MTTPGPFRRRASLVADSGRAFLPALEPNRSQRMGWAIVEGSRAIEPRSRIAQAFVNDGNVSCEVPGLSMSPIKPIPTPPSSAVVFLAGTMLSSLATSCHRFAISRQRCGGDEKAPTGLVSMPAGAKSKRRSDLICLNS